MRETIARLNLRARPYTAFVVVVIVGYSVGVANTIPRVATEELLLLLLITGTLTLAYLYLGLRDEAYFERYPTPAGTGAYFAIQLSLVFAVQFLLEPGGSWLMSLPMAGTAVERLESRWRWPVYLSILAGMALPFAVRYTWEDALFFTLTFSPAILFVVVFTESLVSERVARERAEQLTAQLEQANHQLAAYATQAEELATIQERNRLAREIHDNLGHYLTVVNVQIRVAQTMLESDPEKAQDALEKAQLLTQEGLGAVRQSVAALRDSPTGSRPLSESIDMLLADTRGAGVATELVLGGTERPLDAKTELTLYRAAQEGLTNVRRHARASRVEVTLDYSRADQVVLEIADDGTGTAVATGTSSGFGLLGIRERVHQLGGSVTTQTAPDAGFTLRIQVPG